jgi:hypothetical protein
MITLPPETQARLEAGDLSACWLIDLDFLGGVLHLTTYGVTRDFTAGGVVQTYRGVGDALAVDTIKEGEDVRPDQMTISLSLANTAMLGAALGAVHTYRGRPMRVWLQLLDSAGVIAGAAELRFVGVMDKVNVSVDVDGSTGARRGRIDLSCGRKGLMRARHAEGMRLSHQQHQHLYPGDRGLEYLADMIDRPRVWLSKRFQTQ